MNEAADSSYPAKPTEVNICHCGTVKIWVKNGKLQPWAARCPCCRLITNRRSHDNNRDVRNARSKAAYAKNPDKKRNGRKDYYQRNKKAAADYQRKYIAQHPEKVRKIKRAWYRTEKGKNSAQETKAKWEAANPGKKQETARKWLKTESGKRSHERSSHKRRAQKRATPVAVTAKELNILRDHFTHCCYCGSTDRLTIDHVHPLSKNGAHSLDNLLMACKSCNSKKTYLFPHEWAKKTGLHIFPLQQPLTDSSPATSEQSHS